MKPISNSELIDWNRRGLIPGPDEPDGEFIARVQSAEAQQPAHFWGFSESQRVPLAQLASSFEQSQALYDLSPTWVALFSSRKGLAPWHGAGTLIWRQEGEPTRVCLQISRSIFCPTQEMVAHELVHAGRVAFNEPRFEEALAYQTSGAWWRRFLGPIIQSPREVWIFFASLFIPMVVDWFIFFPLLYLIPLFVMCFGFARLLIRQRTLARCVKRLQIRFGDSSKARALLYRLSDVEIERFSQSSSSQIDAYAENHPSLRWRMLRLSYFLLLFLFLPVSAAPPSADGFARVDPNLLVCGGVNLVTGDYVETVSDVNANCVEPLQSHRFFCSRFGTWHGWKKWHFEQEQIRVWISADGHEKKLVFEELGGGQIPLKEVWGRDRRQPPRYKFADMKGYCNTSSGVLSARTNLSNQTFYFEPGQNQYRLTTSSGEERIYRELVWHRSEYMARERGEEIEYTYVLSEIIRSNGNRIRFKYERNPRTLDHEVSEIEAVNKAGKVLGWINHSRGDGGDRIYHTIYGSDKREVCCVERRRWNERDKEFPWVGVEEVRYPGGYKEKLGYGVQFLRRGPGGRAFCVKYDGVNHFWPGGKVGRVREIQTTDSDGSLKPFLKFQGSVVTDACGGTKSISTNRENRPTWIKTSHIERMVWDKERLVGKTRHDLDGNCISARTFKYDRLGNVVEETLWGDLSGKCQKSIDLDKRGMPVDNGVEAYTKKFTIKGWNLPASETDGTYRIEFDYLGKSDQLTRRAIYEGEELRKLETFTYDDSAALIESTVQEGSMHLVTRITRRDKWPAFGLPEVKEELYQDETGEHLLRRTLYTYNDHCQVVQEEVVGAYIIDREYDKLGRVVREVDPLGQEIVREFDFYGNCLYEQGPREGNSTRFIYDQAGRLSSIDKGVCVERYQYDRMGRRTQTVDFLGNESHVEYDRWGNPIREVGPPILTDEGWQRPETVRTFDSFGRVVEETDPCGFVTRTEYNARDQVIRIEYPDGTCEESEYFLNGELRRQVARNGAETLYERDSLGNVTRQEVAGIVTLATYEGDRPLTKTDGMGVTTHYRYDGAGRLVEERKGDARTTYEYDQLGRQCRVVRWNGSEEAIVKETEYDLLDRVVKESTSGGPTVTYAYDGDGNRILTVRDGEERMDYDCLGRPIHKTDPEGHETQIAYEVVDHILRQTVIDPLERESITDFDSSGHVVRRVKGGVETRFTYDLCGNKTSQVRDTTAITWTYGPMGRVESMDEGSGRLTRYLYNSSGQLETQIKPSGSTITKLYDGHGRLARRFGDGFDDSFGYDQNHRVTDAGKGTRSYDLYGNLISETLENGLHIGCEYDLIGRVTRLLLPDGSDVVYTYEGGELRSIRRGDLAHTFEEYDDQGRPICEQLPQGVGEILRSRDLLGRFSSVEAPYFSQSATYDGVGNILFRSTNDREDHYGYDALDQLCSEDGCAYEYDALHNRISQDGVQHTIDQWNQLLADEHSNYSYDEDGRLTEQERSGVTTLYRYDGLDRLIAVEGEEFLIEYTYDPFDRRISRTLSYAGIGDWALHTIEHTLFEGNRDIGTISDDRLTAFRMLGPGLGAEIGGAVLIELDGTTYLPIHDHRGSLVALLNLSGELIERATYSAYGVASIPLSCPWGFCSKRTDPLTGFVFFGRRDYLPSQGRWLTRDPAGFSQGPNLYAYVSNRPLTSLDLWGLAEERRGAWGVFRNFMGHLQEFYGRYICCDYGDRRHHITRGRALQGKQTTVEDYWARPVWEVAGKEFAFNPYHNDVHANGIATSYRRLIRRAERLASEHEKQMYYLYNPSFGGPLGASRTVANYLGAWSETAAVGTEGITSLLDSMAPEGWITVHAHSEGALIVDSILSKVGAEYRDRIEVVVYGGACRIPSWKARSVSHYQASRDPIPLVFAEVRTWGSGFDYTVETLPSPPGAFFDHGIDEGTYRGVMDRVISQTLEELECGTI